jgi:pimeloyl-ACP methyl ester carboxylesterase
VRAVNPARLAKALAALAVAGAFAGPSFAGTSEPSALYAEPQRLVAIDGARRLNLYCEGAGRPTVVLDAGAGNSMATWRNVQADIAKFTRACAYDRAGLGFSDAAERSSDLTNIVDDLRRLVKAARIPAPFVYVGHSLAGMIGLVYVATYPDDIVGAVLVDPAFAGELEALQAALPPGRRNGMTEALDRALAAKRACLALARRNELADPRTPEARECLDVGWDSEASSDEVLRGAMVHLQTLPRVWEAQISELESFARADSAEIEAGHPSFGDKPLAVMTRGVEEGVPGVDPEYRSVAEAAWRAGHDRIAALSTLGDNRIVPGARHYIQIDRPQAVVDAVRRVVAVARLK